MSILLYFLILLQEQTSAQGRYAYHNPDQPDHQEWSRHGSSPTRGLPSTRNRQVGMPSFLTHEAKGTGRSAATPRTVEWQHHKALGNTNDFHGATPSDVPANYCPGFEVDPWNDFLTNKMKSFFLSPYTNQTKPPNIKVCF